MSSCSLFIQQYNVRGFSCCYLILYSRYIQPSQGSPVPMDVLTVSKTTLYWLSLNEPSGRCWQAVCSGRGLQSYPQKALPAVQLHTPQWVAAPGEGDFRPRHLTRGVSSSAALKPAATEGTARLHWAGVPSSPYQAAVSRFKGPAAVSAQLEELSLEDAWKEPVLQVYPLIFTFL